MKKFLVIAIVLAFVAPAFAAIEPGDGHYFVDRLGTKDGRICLPCHTPHYARYYEDGPIWNHQPSDETFTGHEGPQTLNGGSRLCMGCHDGVTALSNYGGITTGTDPMGDVPANIGRQPGGAANAKFLADDHSVGILYEGHLKDKTSDFGRGTIEDFLEDDKVECTTCHGAHSARPERGTASSGRGAYLNVSIVASELCRACHMF